MKTIGTKAATMPDILHDAICNELRLALDEWTALLDASDRNQPVNKGRMDWLRRKIIDLCARLDRCPLF